MERFHVDSRSRSRLPCILLLQVKLYLNWCYSFPLMLRFKYRFYSSQSWLMEMMAEEALVQYLFVVLVPLFVVFYYTFYVSTVSWWSPGFLRLLCLRVVRCWFLRICFKLSLQFMWIFLLDLGFWVFGRGRYRLGTNVLN